MSAKTITFAEKSLQPVTDNTARGHVEKRGRHLVYCAACKLSKPDRGGWSNECAKLAKPRQFMGG